MQRWKRLFYYLLLNIFVSACTTLTILTLWERSNNSLALDLSPARALELLLPASATIPAPIETPLPLPTPTEAFLTYKVKPGDSLESIAENHNLSVEELTSVNGLDESQSLEDGEVLRIPLHPKGSIVIDSIIGAGDLEAERVLLRHQGDGELALAGWKLEDEDGNIYTFPHFMFYRDGAVYVHTGVGSNSVIDLYWGLSDPVWQSGETATLLDAQNDVHAVYIAP